MMPRMDGEWFMKTIRASSPADIPVVTISGHKPARTKTKQLHGDYYLMKPG